MDYTFILGAYSCLFWTGSAIEFLENWATPNGKQYRNSSEEFYVADFAECNICLWKKESQTRTILIFKEFGGSCQLVYERKAQLVPPEGFQAYVE
ncbi:unnamed protein product [Darwinula stevensoni]|uniref:Uncharacterized protein n=1 Tax=Darwinula stevensoni TaxID=69355 RepID=A0A7R9A2E9_9CRUS|nr:unnamed protein product [Darwinula stevensoni]CAG0888589.1 unnamed protein product [Darwinula stevensoni]